MHRVYSSAGHTTIYPIVFNLVWLLDKHESATGKTDDECNQVHTLHFLEIWLNSIGYNSNGAPILLIGSHKDMVISPAEYRNLSNFDIAQKNDDIKRAHQIIGDFITSLRVYKLGKLNLHMPPQPSLLHLSGYLVHSAVLITHLHAITV